MAGSSSQDTEWEAIDILKERGDRYYIQWAGIDPATNKPWKPTWEPKALANRLLVEDWKEKKRKRKRRSSTRNQYRSQSISYWSSNASSLSNPEKTRRSARSSIVEHSATTTPCSTSNSRNKRRKTQGTFTPVSPSKIHPTDDQSSIDGNQQSPSHLNSSQKLKRTIIPETQTDEESDKTNHQTKPKSKSSLKPTRVHLVASSPNQDPPQQAKDSGPIDHPAVPADDTSRVQDNTLGLFSSDSSSRHSTEVEDEYSNLGQANLLNPPPPLSTSDNQSPIHPQQSYEPDAETAERIASLNDYDDPDHLQRITHYISKSCICTEDKKFIIEFIQDPISYLADPTNELDQLRRQCSLKDCVGFEIKRRKNGSIILWLETVAGMPPKYFIRWDSENVRAKLASNILRYTRSSDISDPSPPHDDKINLGTEPSHPSQEPDEHPSSPPHPHSSPGPDRHPSSLSHPESSHPFQGLNERRSHPPEIETSQLTQENSCHDHPTQDLDEHRTPPPTKPSYLLQEDLSLDPDEHRSSHPETVPWPPNQHDPTQENPTQENPTQLEDPTQGDPTQDFNEPRSRYPENEPSHPTQDSHSHQSFSYQNARSQKPGTAPDSSDHVRNPLPDRVDGALSNQVGSASLQKQTPTASRPTDVPPDESQDDSPLPPATSQLGNSNSETILLSEDQVRLSGVEPHPIQITPTEGSSQTVPLSNKTEDRSRLEPLSNEAAPVEYHSQVEPLSDETATDDESQMTREELQKSVTGLRALLKGALEANALLESRMPEKSGIEAELKKQKETVEELKKQKETVDKLKNRLRQQDVEMTGQRVQLMNSELEVNRLSTKVKSLETLLATEEKQPARILYQKFSDRQKQELAQAQAESRLSKEAFNRLQKQNKIYLDKNDELVQSFAQQVEELRDQLETANMKIRAQSVQIGRLNVHVKDLEETCAIQEKTIATLEADIEMPQSQSENGETDHQDETQSLNPTAGGQSQTFRPISQLERCSLGGPKPTAQVNQSLETIHSDEQEDPSQITSQAIKSHGLRSASHLETCSPHSSPDPRRSCPPPNAQKTIKTLRTSVQYSSSPLCPPRFGTSLTTPTSIATSYNRPPP